MNEKTEALCKAAQKVAKATSTKKYHDQRVADAEKRLVKMQSEALRAGKGLVVAIAGLREAMNETAD